MLCQAMVDLCCIYAYSALPNIREPKRAGRHLNCKGLYITKFQNQTFGKNKNVKAYRLTGAPFTLVSKVPNERYFELMYCSQSKI